MAKDIWDKHYERDKERRINAIYSDVLCELLLLRYELVFENIYKKDILKEIPGIRELKPKQIEIIYEKAIKLLQLKYDVTVIQDSPFIFTDNKDLQKVS